MRNLYIGPSRDTFYQVSAKGFQRRRLKCEKLTDDKRRTPSDGKSSHCLWQGELKMNKIFFTFCHREIYFSGGRKEKRVGESRRGVGERRRPPPILPLIHVLMFVVYVLVIIEYDHGISLILPSYVI